MLRFLPSPLLFFLLALPVQANESTPPGIGAGTYIQATLALLLIVGLLLGATWAARKVSGGKMFGQGNMRVISGIALGPKERIMLVEVEDTWLVIGLVPGQIRTLHTLPKGVDVKLAPDGSKASDTPFADWLQSIKERRNDAR